MTGKELEAWRTQKGLSRTEAGILLDCGPDYIYVMERQGRTIGVLRARMCWLLGNPTIYEAYKKHIGFTPTPKRFTKKEQEIS